MIMKPSHGQRRKPEAHKLTIAANDSSPKPSQKRLPITSPTFLTVKDVAERWALSERQVRRIIASGELRVRHIGRSVRIAIEDIELFEHRCRGVAI
jgi:excisionase family DNA binding protein